ncbi:MAG: DUF1573 domain-containing protein [Flavobacteriaceae bacterium]
MIHLVKVCTLSLIAILFSLNITAQSSKSNDLAMNIESKSGVFQFENDVLDYGTILKDSNGKRVFTFKNTGNSPIVINKVKASCGCTVATKPNAPIMPGETAEIGVSYATSRVGKFSKSITISSNASEQSKVLRIKGEVLKVGSAVAVVK